MGWRGDLEAVLEEVSTLTAVPVDFAASFATVELSDDDGESWTTLWSRSGNQGNVWFMQNVDLSTPHIAGYSFDGKVDGMIMIYEACCKHFGLHVARSANDFLPAPEVPEIVIVPEQLQQAEERLLHDIVQQVYVINRDDFNMREILLQPEDEQAAWFDGLRRDYAIRREFQYTSVVLPGIDCCLVNKVAGLGFKTTL